MSDDVATTTKFSLLPPSLLLVHIQCVLSPLKLASWHPIIRLLCASLPPSQIGIRGISPHPLEPDSMARRSVERYSCGYSVTTSTCLSYCTSTSLLVNRLTEVEMGIDLTTWRARIGLNYSRQSRYACRPLPVQWRAARWGMEEVMNSTPPLLQGCMVVVSLSLILRHTFHRRPTGRCGCGNMCRPKLRGGSHYCAICI